MNDILYKNGNVIIHNVENFDLMQTLDCGQAFRWSCDQKGKWSGIAGGRYLELYKDGKDIIISGTDKNEFEKFWYDYFDLERDYGSIIKTVSSDDTLKKAASYGSGIRILRQDPWEALCSFIISQNNNIPRIKGIIERMCEKFGEKCCGGFSFPSADTLANANTDDLEPLRCGFRARYIIDAAKKVSSGEINLEYLKSCDENEARNSLMGIVGVGPKVADCTMLFGLGRINAFPRDVWIKKAMNLLFKNGLPECAKGFEGIVQQYIFFYSRSGNLSV